MSGLLATLTLTSKFFITMAFATAYQYTTELYPTVIRAVGLSCGNFWARAGAVVATYMPLMVTLNIYNHFFIKYLGWQLSHFIKR